MSAPVVTSVVYGQQSYNPGDPMQVTITGQAGSSITTHNVTGTATFTDVATGLSGTLSGLATITEPVEDVTTGSFTDTDGRLWTQVSLSQTPAGIVTAVYTAKA